MKFSLKTLDDCYIKENKRHGGESTHCGNCPWLRDVLFDIHCEDTLSAHETAAAAAETQGGENKDHDHHDENSQNGIHAVKNVVVFAALVHGQFGAYLKARHNAVSNLGGFFAAMFAGDTLDTVTDSHNGTAKILKG